MEIEWSLKIKKKVFLKKIRGDDTKKTKRLTEIQVFKKMFTKRVFKKNESNSYLNQSAIEKFSLICSQINLIKFVLNQI